MSDAPDELRDGIEQNVREEYEAKRVGGDERERRFNEHVGHLIRRTTSEHTVDDDSPGGIEVTSTVTIPDTYCFTCGEWLGLSGVELSGTPRSREDAFYLGGEPDDVRDARSDCRETLSDLMYRVRRDVEHVETLADARDFVDAELSHVGVE